MKNEKKIFVSNQNNYLYQLKKIFNDILVGSGLTASKEDVQISWRINLRGQYKIAYN